MNLIFDNPFSAYHSSGNAGRIGSIDERWKYIFYLQDVRQSGNQKYFRIQSILTDYPTRKKGDEDLFDLQPDPYELKNLADNAKHAERIAAMKAAAFAWWKETGGQPFDEG